MQGPTTSQGAHLAVDAEHFTLMSVDIGGGFDVQVCGLTPLDVAGWLTFDATRSCCQRRKFCSRRPQADPHVGRRRLDQQAASGVAVGGSPNGTAQNCR
jgi:hypothetical protein